MIITSRFQLLEIGDQSQYPELLREYSHLVGTQIWQMDSKGKHGERSTPAKFTCDAMIDYMSDLSSFTLVDPRASGGGPTLIMGGTLST